MAFYNEMESARDRLLAQGHEVKVPELALPAPEEFGGGNRVNFAKYVAENGGMDAFPMDHRIWDVKEGAIRNHFEKVDWADAILVVNPEKRGIEGYVGGNTLIEIGVAFYTKKPIYIQNPISSELSYRQEIYGMKPIILDDDFSALR